jgi:hypothetical protein
VDYKLDMSVMLAIHQALRRDLERLGRIAAKSDGDSARLLRAALGWGAVQDVPGGTPHGGRQGTVAPVARSRD